MTDLDRQYMVDVDDDNLRAFLNWHDDARKRGVLNISLYALLKMCWMAAKNTPREPELAPSRNVLPPAKMAYSPEAGYEMREEPFRAPVRKMETPRRRSFNPEFDFRVRPGDQVRFNEPPPEPFPHQQWPARSPEAHRQAQLHVETQAMPALPADPFARVRLSGPQQAALDRMYPETTPDLPVVGPVESISDHRRQQMEARYAGLANYGPPGPVMTPLQALPEPEDG